jgi:hypothetical protein
MMPTFFIGQDSLLANGYDERIRVTAPNVLANINPLTVPYHYKL